MGAATRRRFLSSAAAAPFVQTRPRGPNGIAILTA